MPSSEKKMPVTADDTQSKRSALAKPWHPLANLRQQIDHLFEDFSHSPLQLPFGRRMLDVEPFFRRELMGHGIPAVDIAEKEKSFEITAELPGMDEKNIEIKLSNGNLVIKGEKREQTEEKKKDYYLSERHYGSFERIFNLPKGVDAEKIEAHFSKGVLTISLPKKPEAIKPEKHIDIKVS
ncbi:Hsp20/alpha crystallin family protein [Pseudomonas sp.]|jgi:HSP20 family protein|uniref:Hsp20/alpha crystallin family protein n=1 Tax=Pseudomonas sp. TaxID=306 RepID=UPI002731F71E|nr:Hsp20/alpha crystallin family protein [Pseudomonas sp.]MDP2244220.1 Hsp20/alpha crystallin family protein [Pseudomonas sp.]